MTKLDKVLCYLCGGFLLLFMFLMFSTTQPKAQEHKIECICKQVEE